MTDDPTFITRPADGPAAADRVRRGGVVMGRRPLASRWQSHAWTPLRVEVAPGLTTPALLHASGGTEEWLYPELEVELFRDEAEGYYLNLSAPAPVVFVHWSQEESVVSVLRLTLSYHQAARFMDGGMQVDPVPLPAAWLQWLSDFTRTHYRPETRQPRARPPSFRGARRTARDG